VKEFLLLPEVESRSLLVLGSGLVLPELAWASLVLLE